MEIFWENPGWEQEDRHFKQMKEMPFERSFPFIPEKKGLYVIRGPRQVGKSSWLKKILSHYAQQGVSSFYLSCETVTHYQELSEILKSVRNRKVVLLDEVSFVESWDRAIKSEIDSGKSHILVVTGSHAHDLKRGADRMPGRFDGGGEFLLLPMLFAEFEAMRKKAKWHSGNRIEELQAYFRVGGFPTAVAEGGRLGKTPKKAIQTYWRWLSGDVVQLGKQEIYLKELLIQLALCLQTPLSLQTLAKKTGIGSHNTVQEYVSVLDSCFALRTLYCMDLDTGAHRFRKDKKFYFTDPLLYWMALGLSGRSAPDSVEERIAELVANEELNRRSGRVGYFSNQKGEIDFVSPKQWAIEVKWASVIKNVSKAYFEQSFPEKIVWSQENFLAEFPRGF